MDKVIDIRQKAQEMEQVVSQPNTVAGMGLAQKMAGQSNIVKANSRIDNKTPLLNQGVDSKQHQTGNVPQQGQPNQQGPGGLPPVTNGLAGMYSNIPNLYTIPNSNYTITNGVTLI